MPADLCKLSATACFRVYDIQMIRAVVLSLCVIVSLSLGVFLGLQIAKNHQWFTDHLVSPLKIGSELTKPQVLPLTQLSIPELQKREFSPGALKIIDVGEPEVGFSKYLFQFETLGKKMTGQLNIPDAVDTENPPATILLLRGYVPIESYTTGVSTKNAAARFARAGYITIAPDFFGYGQSDPEPEDPWQARFEKPAIIAELLRTITSGVPITPTGDVITPKDVGIWAHSNGGQIAITTLEVLKESHPTTLWAPVTAPFPYSILYFGDEVADEGKSQRAWIALFEREYDVHQFTHTQFLQDLRGPLQFQQGTIDDAVPFFWTEEFIDKLELENLRRNENASAPAKIEFSYYKYPGADHNLLGAWENAVQRDLDFFAKYLDR